MISDLTDDGLGNDFPEAAEICIRNHACHARSEVRKHKNRHRHELNFTGHQRKVLLDGAMLSQQETVRANGRFGFTSAATGKTCQRRCMGMARVNDSVVRPVGELFHMACERNAATDGPLDRYPSKRR